jgi:sugar O-acyltransferase (sialic acid O-acetyltransferase NeuD family)
MSIHRVAILGCGGFAREVYWAVNDGFVYPGKEKAEVVGFVDRKPRQNGFYGLPVWTLDQLDRSIRLICGIGGMPEIKQRVITEAEEAGFTFAPPIVYHNVAIGPNVSLGEGTIVCAGNILTVDIQLGRHVAVNLDCTIGHDCVVGDFTTISPGAHISGRVTMGTGVYIGTGTSVIEGLSLGSYSVTGAGAVVTKDVLEQSLVVGVPAQVKKLPRELACPVPRLQTAAI